MENRDILKLACRRGLKRRCPHCGEGELFLKGVTMHRKCPVCGIQYLKNQGDTWAFLLVFDRVFLLLPIIAIFFGLLPRAIPFLIVLFTVWGIGFLKTTPNRYGLCVGLDYWTRILWGDLAGRLPLKAGEVKED